MTDLNSIAQQLAQDAHVTALLELALSEDIGKGDVTTQLMVPEDASATARLLAREPGILAGVPILRRIVQLAGAELEISSEIGEGDSFLAGQEILVLRGPARVIITLERLMLNVLQRLSGIATMTRAHVVAVAKHDCVILETRKTVPGWRRLDKYAVLAGGGANHRMGLFDQVLAKENHFALAGVGRDSSGFEDAVRKLVKDAGASITVEVEVEDTLQFRAAMSAGAHIIMLDNMSLEDMALAVRECAARFADSTDQRPLLEASGGITLGRLGDVAATGVDRISVGALTHSVKALDISLLIEF